MKNLLVQKQSLLTAILLFLIIAGWIFSGNPFASDISASPALTPSATDHSEQPLPIVRTRASTAEPFYPSIEIYSVSEPVRTLSLKAETSGKIQQLLYQQGNRVASGEPILKIDPDERLTQRRYAAAMVKQRQIEYDVAQKLFKKDFSTETRLAEAETLLAAALSEQERIEADLRKTTLSAPFPAYIEALDVEKGDFVATGQTVARLIDIESILFTGHITEREYAFLKIGDAARIETLQGKSAEGKITYLSKEADAMTRTFRIEVTVPNADTQFVAGLSATVSIQTAPIRAHLVEPAQIIINDKGQLGVMSIDQDSRLRFLPAHILLSSANETWLTGLPDSFDLVTTGHSMAKSGDRVISHAASPLNSTAPSR
jgi:multidrug efflux system membrane fusion protein